MTRWIALIALLAACDVTPLTREQLFGKHADAAADIAARDVAPSDLPPEGPPPEPACVARSHDGLFSGAVLDACNGASLDASVGIGGQHACTFAQKGTFQFRDLPVGCNLTVAATAPGYAPHYATVMVDVAGTANYLIRLDRLSDPLCQSLPPPAPACRCDVPGCITP
jgi:hypothetical protein